MMPDRNTGPNPRCSLTKTEFTYEFRVNGRVFRAIHLLPRKGGPTFILCEICERYPQITEPLGEFPDLQACREKVVELVGENCGE